MEGWTIGEAARRAGVGVETIRFYEREGLIEQPPRPNDSGYRRYPESTIRRIRFIRQARELGFSLKEIGELIHLRRLPGADASQVRAWMETRLAQVNQRIGKLERLRRVLEALIASCPMGGPLSQCAIINALEQGVIAIQAEEE
ncbi:MerR family transcriptional regulator [Pelomicrobium sp.]|jgi:MerR family copper efflux transcriptional regulator|uniref:MerR family transcriptional regulator n=1 Tax=Pelomicrobium sp. TaxID=2815319 RepID=UPI002FDDE4C5